MATAYAPDPAPTPIASWVEAAPFRAHLHLVMSACGLDPTEVATLLGVPARTLVALAEGRNGRPVRRLERATALALLDLDPRDRDRVRMSLVPAAESRRRLELLRRDGVPLAAVAERLGLGVPELSALSHPRTDWCSALVALRLLTATRRRRLAPVAA